MNARLAKPVERQPGQVELLGSALYGAAIEAIRQVVGEAVAEALAEPRGPMLLDRSDLARALGERTGCTFVVLIHSKKKSNSAVEIDARERGRGSSAIYDAADAQLSVEYARGKPLQVVQTKARSGRYIEPFQVTIEDGDGGSVHVVATDLPKVASAATDDFEGVVCVTVLEALRANPGASTRLLTETCGKRYGKVSAALEHLERNGAAKNTGTGKAGRWFAT